MPISPAKISTITATNGTTYNLAAKYDVDGNEITETYATKGEVGAKYTFEGGINRFSVTPEGEATQYVPVTPDIPGNIVAGSGLISSGHLAQFDGANTISNGPAIGSSTTTFLRNDGTWATPPKQVYYTSCSTAATTAAKEISLSGVTSLYNGLTVFVYFNYANYTERPTLSVNSGEAKYIYRTGGMYAGYGPDYSWRQSEVVCLVYVNGSWYISNWKDNNENLRYNGSFSTSNSMTSGTVIAASASGSRYKTIAAGDAINITYPILYYGGSESFTAQTSTSQISGVYFTKEDVDLSNTVSGWTGDSTNVYLVGTLSGTTLTVDSAVFTTTIPTSADGKVYIYIGRDNSLISSSQIYFNPTGQIFAYQNGVFGLYDPNYDANAISGSGTSGYLTKFNAAHGVTNGPQLGSSTTTYLRNNGTWGTPPGTPVLRFNSTSESLYVTTS